MRSMVIALVPSVAEFGLVSADVISADVGDRIAQGSESTFSPKRVTRAGLGRRGACRFVTNFWKLRLRLPACGAAAQERANVPDRREDVPEGQAGGGRTVMGTRTGFSLGD